MKVKSEIAYRVYKRDGFRCTECGRTGPLVSHHLIPKKQGGKDTLKNLVTLCVFCHEKYHPWIKFRRSIGWRVTRVDDIGQVVERIYEETPEEVNQAEG